MMPPVKPSTENPQQDAIFMTALLHLMEDACATLDADARITSVNAGMEQILNVHQSKLIGNRMADVLPDAASDRINDAIADGCAWEARLEVFTGRIARMQLYPAYDSSGGIGGWVAIVRLIDQNAGPIDSTTSAYDPLTNLPGRELVISRLGLDLQNARIGEQQVTLLCVDIDGFDAVNRDHGRATGDQVLIETAKRLGRSLRASNIIGRLQEDMFIVAIADIRSHEQINAVAQRLIEAIAVPFKVKGARHPIQLTASIGIAIAPESGSDADELIGHAQTAVDLAKSTATGTYQFYTNQTGVEIRERRSRVNRLRRAIDDGHLQLLYQPKVSLASGKIVAAEALIRWQDPDSGIIMPGEFIPMAEDAGLIDPIGQLVLIQACETLAAWQKGGMPFLRIAVNVSAREIARPSFYDDLMGIIRDSGIEPDSLELEITESAVMEGAEDVIRSLREIRSLGVHLTADDFGTGYASLSYLRNFPLDGIKIDTTFVSDIVNPDGGGGGLASAVIAVGHCLDMNVVAEGVETEDQLDFLRWRDCDEVQGFLISEPLSSEAFTAMVDKGAVL